MTTEKVRHSFDFKPIGEDRVEMRLEIRTLTSGGWIPLSGYENVIALLDRAELAGLIANAKLAKDRLNW